MKNCEQKGKDFEPRNRFTEDLEFVSEHDALNCLLKDRTTGRNISWATGGVDEEKGICKAYIKKRIRPRWLKNAEARK